jgi:hypothetical protein
MKNGLGTGDPADSVERLNGPFEAADVDLSVAAVRALAARLKDQVESDLTTVQATDEHLRRINARLQKFNERHTRT